MVSGGELAEACADIGYWLAVAETLLAHADELPAEGGPGRPGSRPPWNPAVANALMDAHSGIRDLEADMRFEVTGTVRRRSDRAGNTGDVLSGISAMEMAVSRPHHDRAIRLLTRWALAIRQLTAVDRSPRWERIRPAEEGGMPPVCPYCECYSLRVAIQAGLVACWNPACCDPDGKRPEARLDISRLDGSPVLVWRS